MSPLAQNVISLDAVDAVSGSRELNVLDATFSIGGLQDRLFALLSAIEAGGSLVVAAKTAGLSYKGAWDMIERASLLSPRPLIERSPGGGSDRGTRLTETGRALLQIHRNLEVRKAGILKELNRELSQDPILLQWFRRLILKSSTRNQWRAEVLSIKKGVVNNEVSVRLPGGATIVANLSRESIRQMNLDFGTPVIVLVKTPMVNLMTASDDVLLSAENQFEGQVSHILCDEVSAEVIVGLSASDNVVTTLSADELSGMAIREGDSVTVSFDADAVILASPSSAKDTR